MKDALGVDRERYGIGLTEGQCPSMFCWGGTSQRMDCSERIQVVLLGTRHIMYAVGSNNSSLWPSEILDLGLLFDSRVLKSYV